MTTFNEQFQKYWDYQAGFFEPVRAFGGVAAETFERIARQNYAVLGDYVEFAVEQARLPAQVTDVNDYVGKQITNSRAFGDKLVQRAREYADIAQTAQVRTQHVVAAVAPEQRRDRKAA